MGNNYFAVHAHFYQPPRHDPFTGEMPQEPGAQPYHDFNEKINAECYRPNAEAGNFSHISFNVGPTLATWLERHDLRTYETIIAADQEHARRFGVGNAIAQAYNHTILPLATEHEKRVQVAWGIKEFAHRFGRKPEGMWLAETAVDYETLAVLADMDIKFTVLAPWQVSGPIESNEPYWVRLRDGRRIAVFFFNAALSGAVSFDGMATVSAEVFTSQRLKLQVNIHKEAEGQPQLILLATDGELYGHHKPWRDLFLKHLLTDFAPRAGFEVTALTRYLQSHAPRHEVTLLENTSWSCHHGVERWKDSCHCIDGDGAWKSHLRRALGRLAARIDRIYEIYSSRVLRDPWQALEDYIVVKLGSCNWQEFLAGRMRWNGNKSFVNGEAGLVLQLLEAQYYRQLMFASCAFFFEDFDRIEPRNSIALGARAIAIVRDACAIDLSGPFEKDLAWCKSWRTGRLGPEIYQEVSSGRRPRRSDPLQPVSPAQLPLLN